mgnify:CR=1 FL=1
MATGNDFTSYEIINTYKTLLYASSTTPSSTLVNEGFNTDLKDIRTGDGAISPLQISTDFVNLNGSNKLMLDGTVLTASASTLNALAAGAGTVTRITTGDNTVLFTESGVSVSTAETSLTAVVNPTLSITNLYASTGIFIAGAAIPSAGEITSINNVTTSINTVITAVSAALAASIGNSNTNITANAAAITSINTVVADVSSALATSIGNSNTNITANAAAITSINTVVANVSSALATSIGNSNTNITANAAAITSINTVVANVSSALATSIANHLPLAGGTLTGGVSGTNLVLSGGLGLGTVTAFLGKKARMIGGAAIADLVTLTDGANIATDFNTGQNFTVTLGGNRTLDNPTNCEAGQVGSYIVFTSTDVQAILTKAYS